MTNSQWPMTETVALLAGRGRPTGQCLCGSWAPLSRGRPVMTLVIGHWAFIGDWSLVIVRWSCTILCQRPCSGPCVALLSDLPSGFGRLVFWSDGCRAGGAGFQGQLSDDAPGPTNKNNQQETSNVMETTVGSANHWKNQVIEYVVKNGPGLIGAVLVMAM